MCPPSLAIHTALSISLLRFTVLISPRRFLTHTQHSQVSSGRFTTRRRSDHRRPFFYAAVFDPTPALPAIVPSTSPYRRLSRASRQRRHHPRPHIINHKQCPSNERHRSKPVPRRPPRPCPCCPAMTPSNPGAFPTPTMSPPPPPPPPNSSIHMRHTTRLSAGGTVSPPKATLKPGLFPDGDVIIYK